VIVNSWSEVNQEFLEQKYSELLLNDRNLEILGIDYWANLIVQYKFIKG
jgi:hypothetical protein